MSDVSGSDIERQKDGKVDAMAAVVLVTLFVVSILFWLSNQ